MRAQSKKGFFGHVLGQGADCVLTLQKARLLADPGLRARCWPSAELGRRLRGGPPAIPALLQALEAEGYTVRPLGNMLYSLTVPVELSTQNIGDGTLWKHLNASPSAARVMV